MLLHKFLVIFAITSLVGCSGGSTSSITPPGAEPTTNAGAGNAQSISILPAPNNQPNTVSPNLQIDGNGAQHSVYSNIDGQVVYAACNSQCADSGNWTDVIVLSAAIDSILGYAVPKLQIDQNGTLHLAVVVNLDGGVVFASQQTHYFQCQSECLSARNWVGEVVHVHSDGHLEEDLENTHWFELTAEGNPKLAFIETPPGLFGDEFLYVISCNQNCTGSLNWQTQQVTGLNIASKMPATIRRAVNGGVRLFYEYQVIASDRSELQYVECITNCDSNNSTWSTPVSIQALNRESLNHNAFAADLIADTAPYVALLSITDGMADVEVITCVERCSQASNWISTSILPNIDLPVGTTIAGRSIDLNFDRGSLDIGLLAKQSNLSVASTLARISCTTNCFEGSWSYQEIASSASIRLESVGNCAFVATGLAGPINLLANAAAVTMVPHWACSGQPIEVTDANGNIYIDYNSDVRFFEIASIAQVL